MERNITEKFTGALLNVKESGIDPDNLLFKGVCLFGRRESENNRVYSDKAIDSIAKLADGTKCFINHITKTEFKERGGVRDLRDWVGVFESPYRKGEAVHANLRVREQYFDLMKDIAAMQPKGVGHSIDATVQILVNDEGKESVADVTKLRSVDIVSSAATVDNLWESIGNKIEENLSSRLLVVPNAIRNNVELLFLKEGISRGQIDGEEKIKEAISEVSEVADKKIRDLTYDDKLTMEERKEKIIAVYEKLGEKVKEKVKTLKEDMEGKKMDLTVEILKTKYRDLVETLREEFKTEEKTEKMKSDLDKANGLIKTLGEEKKTLESTVADKEKEIEELKTKLQETKTKLDEKELAEKIAKKKEKINQLIAESKLPKEAISDVFLANLMSLEEYKEGDTVVTVEEQAKTMLKDRLELLNKNLGKVKGVGDEFKGEEQEQKQEVTESDVDEFVKKIK